MTFQLFVFCEFETLYHFIWVTRCFLVVQLWEFETLYHFNSVGCEFGNYDHVLHFWPVIVMSCISIPAIWSVIVRRTAYFAAITYHDDMQRKRCMSPFDFTLVVQGALPWSGSYNSDGCQFANHDQLYSPKALVRLYGCLSLPN